MSKKKYTNHLIECQCILQIFKNKTKPLYHKFTVFSEHDDEDNIIEKYVSCNNCESIHHVKEILKSELVWGKDYYLNFVTTKNDIKFNLNSLGYKYVVDILEENNCEINVWENVLFCIKNKIKDNIIINKKEIEEVVLIKSLDFDTEKFTISNNTYQKDFSII